MEVKPGGQVDAHRAMAVSLQESFPGVSISDSVLLVTNYKTQGRSQT